MAKIFDLLSEKNKVKLEITQNDLDFSIGSVHSINMTEKDGIVLKEEDKKRGYRSKMNVVVAVKEDVNYATVLINSEPNINCITEENIKRDCHPIYRKDYSFIKEQYNPSFVDCGRLFYFDKGRLEQEEKCIGYLTGQDCHIVLQKIKDSERIDVIDLMDLGFIEGY
jgi:hypothetical protein